MSDLISRAEVNKAISRYCRHFNTELPTLYELVNELPSANAEPTVIRSRTLMPTKDFKEWAKRVRETNPNAVVIPCDAEVVSADAVQGEWIRKEKEINDCEECERRRIYASQNETMEG